MTAEFYPPGSPTLPAFVDVTNRSGRSLGVVTSILNTVVTDVSDNAARQLGLVGLQGGADVTDRAARLLGVVSGSVAVTSVAGTLTVTGSVAITGTVDVGDRAGRLLGVVSGSVAVTSVAGTVTVTGSVAITGTVDVGDRAGRALGVVSGSVAVTSVGGTVDVGDRAGRALGVVSGSVAVTPVTLSQTVTGGANAVATATLPAAGAGLFHYITHISIRRVATAALAGGAILAVTTTNLGGRSWRTGNQMSVTVSAADPPLLIDQEYVHALRSDVANTNTVISGPAAGAAVSWQIVIDYYTGP